MDSSDPGSEIQSVVKAETQGCGIIILLLVLIAWIIGTTAISQFSSWSLEQAIFDGEVTFPDVRWLIELVYGIALLIPLVLSALFVKNLRYKARFQTWMLAGVLALAFTPLRLLPIIAEQPLEVLQIVVLVLYIGGISIWVRRIEAGSSQKHSRPAYRGIRLTVLFGAILAYPWVLWGALGSPIDILLQICVALLFGTAVAMTLQFGLFRVTQSGVTKYKIGNVLFDGLVSTLTLLIMLAALGQGGDQLVLMIAIPLLGFGLPFISRYCAEQDDRNNWPVVAAYVGLAVAWPLLWVNADELMLVSNSGPGGLIQWAIQAATVELVLSVVLIIILLILWPKLERMGHYPLLAQALTVLVWLALIPVYLVWGRPGFYGERLFVILKSQPDVSQAVTIKDYNQRRQYVYQTLVKNAESSQNAIRKDLDSLGIRYTPYYLVNGLEVQGGPFVRWWLAGRPEVDRILYDPIMRPLPEPLPLPKGSQTTIPTAPGWNLSLIGADRVWKDFNIRGKGVIIGQNDSGVQGDHPELADSYIGKGGKNDYAWLDPWNHTSKPTDFDGHGTHTLGTILGKNVGIAPDAQWIACVNLARNLGDPAYYLNCWQFMLAPYPEKGDPFRDGDVTRGAEILNNSWGCPTVEGCDPNTFLPAVKDLRDAGIFVVVSAGNSGLTGCSTVEDPPSIYSQVMTVGAIDSSGQLANFSSLGPVKVDGSNRVKPDLVAPGVDVLSSFPGNTYQSESGTSMAGPHVVGVVALMWSANPALVGNIDQTDQILLHSTQPYHGTLPACVDRKTDPNDGDGYGVVDAYQAVKAALDLSNKK
jgi:subtilisin family serine protease